VAVHGSLVESMGQTDEIVRGVRAPSREFYVDAARALPRAIKNNPQAVLKALAA
jgi:hypothetical protein